MADSVASTLAHMKMNPEVDAVKWHSAGCPDCSHLDGLEWTLDAEPMGHNTQLTSVPPVGYRCRGILLPMGYFGLYFDEAIRRKAFDEADALINTRRRDAGSEAWQRLKAEVAGRRAAHEAGQRFIRKKFLPEEFW